MKRGILYFFILALFAFGAARALAQEKSAITVKSTELSNGVVIVDVLKAGKSFELQCNQGLPSCNQLKSGKYQMIELPENSGMYDCRDVQIYNDPAATPEPGDKKLGEYCLTAK
jgi:hypothetical protein